MDLTTAGAGKSAGQPDYFPMTSVLIVDDEALIRWSVAESLEAAGYAVVEAATAADALRVLQEGDGSIGVAVLDLKLPDSSDLSLLRRFRSSVPECRVILMTAHGTPEVLDEALRSGAFAVLTKPFDLTQLVTLVGRAAA